MVSLKTLDELLESESISNGDVRYMNDTTKAELLNRTPNCTGNTRERIYWLQNKLDKYPTCITCGDSLTTKNFRINIKSGGYTPNCSVSCAKRNPENAKKQADTVKERYGSNQYLGSKNARKKIEKTNLKKYGSKTPSPWGSERYNKQMIDKYGVIDVKQIEANKVKTTIEQIRQNILSGKTEKTILRCQTSRNVECQDVEKAFDLNRDKLQTITLTWKHLTCGTIYKSKIRTETVKVCPNCKKGASILELALRSIIMENYDGEIQFNTRTVLPSGHELDIYIPELKLAIEFNGIYWHSALMKADKSYHLNKTIACEKRGIKLMHIWENDFMRRESIIKSMLLNALGKSLPLDARRGKVVEISGSDAEKFHKANHVNGFIKSKVNLGLYINEQLVSVMSLGHRRFQRTIQDNSWEIYRFSSHVNYNVRGAASKLFSYFIKNYKPSIVTTFCDRSLGGGSVYTKMGMTETTPTPPSYFWANIDNDVTLTRFKTQKNKLKTLIGDNFDSNLSETENMKRLGWFKLWDCGSRVFTWVNPAST